MSEDDRQNESKNRCYCNCWKAIFIAIALLVIGAVIGHALTMNHYGHGFYMMGPGYQGHAANACWARDGQHQGWWGHRAYMGQYQLCCPCPIHSNKTACSTGINKPGCQMMEKGQVNPAVPEKK
jgi:hypothetical protein